MTQDAFFFKNQVILTLGHFILNIDKTHCEPFTKKVLKMKLNEITDCCSHLEIYEKRMDNEDFFELVFYNKDLDEWNRILTAFLDAPVKPVGQHPSEKDLHLTKNTGSIRIEQTLFEKDYEDCTVIAKFWPWKNNKNTTLRMALLNKI